MYVVGQALLFATARKSTLNLHMAQYFVEKLKAYILLSSWASMGWSKPANIYIQSHDVQRVLYLVLLYGGIE